MMQMRTVKWKDSLAWSGWAESRASMFFPQGLQAGHSSKHQCVHQTGISMEPLCLSRFHYIGMIGEVIGHVIEPSQFQSFSPLSFPQGWAGPKFKPWNWVVGLSGHPSSSVSISMSNLINKTKVFPWCTQSLFYPMNRLSISSEEPCDATGFWWYYEAICPEGICHYGESIILYL